MTRKLRILIADDDQNILKTLAAVLKVKGYTPITASNGKAALETLEQEPPAVALIDLKLEDMSGLELMVEIKTCSPSTECIVITGHATQASAIEAINLGAYNFILKPYNIDHLLVTVSRAIEKRQAREALHEEEEKYRTLFEFANDSIFIIDPSTRKLLDVNHNAAKGLGYTREELLELRVEDVVSPIVTEHKEAILQVLSQTGSVIVEHTHQRKDGTTMPVEISARMVEYGGRQVIQSIARDITDRKEAEEALKGRNQFIETIMDNLPIGLMVNSVEDGTVNYLNSKFAEISGWPEEVITDVDTFFDRVYPDPGYRQEVKERMMSGLASDDPSPMQWENITMIGQTGVQKIVSTTNIPLLEQNLLISTVQDITVRVQMDGELQWASSVNLVLAKLSKTLIDPTFTIEKMAGVILDYAKMLTKSEHGFVASIHPETGDLVSHTLTQMMGQCSIPIEGQRIVFPLGPDGKYSKLWGHALNTKQPFYTNAPDTHTASGGVPEGHVSLRNFLAAPAVIGDLPVGLVAVSNSPDGYTDRELDAIRRLTDLYAAALVRKRGEEALIASEALYHDLVEASQDLIWRCDQEGRFTFLNRAWEETHGYEIEEMVGKPFTDFMATEVAGRALQEFKRHLDGGQVTGYETTYISKSGDEIHLLFNAMPVYNEDGQIIGTQGTAHDITRRKLDERKIRRQLERLEGLHKIDSSITTSTDLDVILEVILEQITVQLEVDAADIYQYEAPTQTLLSSARRGFISNALPETTLRIGDGYAGQVALERRMIHILHLSARVGNKETPATWEEEGFVSYFGVPLFSKGQVKGVLELYHRSALEPDREWLSFLDTLADQAAIAIDNTSLFDGLQRSNLELTLAYDTTLEGWAKALELRDNETEGHSRRVTEMTLRLAREVGIREGELVHVRRGALLHDIGKMGTPDSILHNTGPLSEEEWEIMHRHPNHAYELLSPISFLRPALDIPYCHHEKWDGSGYPRGLRGEQIPQAARIFTVVDVWDALLSDRPYRDAWPKAKVLDYIREQVSKHFDPQVVEVFLRIVEDES